VIRIARPVPCWNRSFLPRFYKGAQKSVIFRRCPNIVVQASRLPRCSRDGRTTKNANQVTADFRAAFVWQDGHQPGRPSSPGGPVIFPTFLQRSAEFRDCRAAFDGAPRSSSIVRSAPCGSRPFSPRFHKELQNSVIPARRLLRPVPQSFIPHPSSLILHPWSAPFYASRRTLWPAFFSDFYYSASKARKIETQQRNCIRRVS
jgi:hypothetical protein